MRGLDKKIIGGISSGIFLLWLMGKVLRGNAAGEGIYKVNARRSAAFSLTCFALDIWAIPAILRAKPLITAQEMGGLKMEDVPAYNRFALRQVFDRKDVYKQTSDKVLRGIVGLSVLFLLLTKNDRGKLLLLFAEAQAAAYTYYSFSFIGPAFQDKFRPVVYYNDALLADRDAGNNRNSRYSGHTGNAAAASFFLAKVYDDYHPQMNGWTRAAIYLIACLPPAVVGYLRVKALKHFPSDVVMATGIGGAFGVMVPVVHKGA